MATRSARTAWTGTLQDGSGRTELASSGLGTFDVSWPKRTSDEARPTTAYKPKVTMPWSSIRHAGLNAISQEWSSGSAT